MSFESLALDSRSAIAASISPATAFSIPGTWASDERTLKEIAKMTGGQYFRATDSEALESIYSEIDRLEKTTNVAEYFQQYAEQFTLFLLPGLALLLLEVVLINTRFRTVP